MLELQTIQQGLACPKGQENSYGGYKYRSCEDILNAVKPLLKETGTVLTLTDYLEECGGWAFVVSVAQLTRVDGTVVGQAKSMARHADIQKGMVASQITGSASSYARKYALNGLFCIDDTKDADATNKHGKDTPKPRPASYATEADWAKIKEVMLTATVGKDKLKIGRAHI